MTPDKTNTPPDPVKLVADHAVALEAWRLAVEKDSAFAANMEGLIEAGHALDAARNAILAEFTRLSALRPAPSPQGLDKATVQECARLIGLWWRTWLRMQPNPSYYREADRIVDHFPEKLLEHAAPTPSETLTAPVEADRPSYAKELDLVLCSLSDRISKPLRHRIIDLLESRIQTTEAPGTATLEGGKG